MCLREKEDAFLHKEDALQKMTIGTVLFDQSKGTRGSLCYCENLMACAKLMTPPGPRKIHMRSAHLLVCNDLHAV